MAAPFPLLRWRKDIPLLFANHVAFWMPQGWVQDEMRNLESTLPGVYLGMRLAWNPAQDPNAALDAFYTRCYGTAAAPMRRYWETMDAAGENTPEHAGTHYGFMRRFPAKTLADARVAMNEALVAARTAAEYRRVKLADDSLREFELYMQMRRDLCEGRFDKLESQGARWLNVYNDLTDQYRGQAAFPSIAADFFQWFCLPVYRDANRIAREGVVLKHIPDWRWQADREKQGEAKGWSAPAFDDSAWPKTDPRVDTWADLGLYNYYSRVWYSTMVNLPAAPKGKKIFLWIDRQPRADVRTALRLRV